MSLQGVHFDATIEEEDCGLVVPQEGLPILPAGQGHKGLPILPAGQGHKIIQQGQTHKIQAWLCVYENYTYLLND